MDHEQKHEEKHRRERREKEAHEREVANQFSKPGPTIRPLWLLVLGGGLVLIALLIWMFLATRS